MNLRALMVLAAALGVASCVTTVSGRQPMEADPEAAAESNLELGKGYLRQGNYQAAQDRLERAAKLNPKLWEPHAELGNLYLRLNDLGEAEKSYQRAVQIAPDDPDALNVYAAFLCRDGGDRQEALKYFDRAAEIPLSKKFVNRAKIYTNAGMCIKPVDLEKSEEYLRRALSVDSRYSEALLQMADVAHQRNNNLQARAFLERYLAVRRPSAAVLWLGVQIEEGNGDLGAAADYSERLKKDFPASVETRLVLEKERNAG